MNIKNIEALISVRFFKRNDKIFQHFIFTKKKGIMKYLRDKRFVLYDKFENKVQELSLSHEEGFEFLDRREEEDRIVLEFHCNFAENFSRDNSYFVIAGFVPPNASCDYCSYIEQETNTSFYCNYKQKFLSQKLKNCKFFKQKHSLFKT